MSVARAFDEIVLSPLANHPEMQRLKQSNPDGVDTIIRNELQRGQSPCDTNLMALKYCYTYLYMHLDAYRQMLTDLNLSTLFSGENCVFVDVGCGPMTSCLAITDYYQETSADYRLNIKYVGIDSEQCMIDIAQLFGARQDLFEEKFKQVYIKSERLGPMPESPDAYQFLSEAHTLISIFPIFSVRPELTERWNVGRS